MITGEPDEYREKITFEQALEYEIGSTSLLQSFWLLVLPMWIYKWRVRRKFRRYQEFKQMQLKGALCSE
jgi:hypothetical protein